VNERQCVREGAPPAISGAFICNPLATRPHCRPLCRRAAALSGSFRSAALSISTDDAIERFKQADARHVGEERAGPPWGGGSHSFGVGGRGHLRRALKHLSCVGESGVRRDLLVGLLAPLPALIAFLTYGALETADSGGYIYYAEQLRAGTLPSGTALFKEAPAPISLFRTPGYPALIAVMQSLIGAAWKTTLVLLQIIAHAALAVTLYRTAVLLKLSKAAATFVALLPSIGLGLVMQVSLLTDAIYAALLGCTALWLVQAAVRPSRIAPVAAGIALAGAMLLREATMFIAVGYAPAVWIASQPGNRLRWFCSAFSPIIAAAALMAGTNYARSGYPVITTTPQVVMVQAVLPLVKQQLPVFDGDDVYDRTARDTLRGDKYATIDELNCKLFLAGLTAPEMAEAATRRYFRAWWRFPGAMFIATISRYRDHFLALAFYPLITLRYLDVHARRPRPEITDPARLWKKLKRGDLSAGSWLLIDVVMRVIGTAIGLAATAAPFLLMNQNDERGRVLLGTWFSCVSCVAVYIPVHLDIRYLVPLIPLQCLLAATLWDAFGSPEG
jgi:hypothetical protein